MSAEVEIMDWTGCELVEVVPGKVSGAPVIRNTRLPAEALTGNVDSFMEVDGLSFDQAVDATLDCYPETPGGKDTILKIVAYRNAHQPLLQP